jgi:hypothetical protein
VLVSMADPAASAPAARLRHRLAAPNHQRDPAGSAASRKAPIAPIAASTASMNAVPKPARSPS